MKSYIFENAAEKVHKNCGGILSKAGKREAVGDTDIRMNTTQYFEAEKAHKHSIVQKRRNVTYILPRKLNCAHLTKNIE